MLIDFHHLSVRVIRFTEHNHTQSVLIPHIRCDLHTTVPTKSQQSFLIPLLRTTSTSTRHNDLIQFDLHN